MSSLNALTFYKKKYHSSIFNSTAHNVHQLYISTIPRCLICSSTIFSFSVLNPISSELNTLLILFFKPICSSIRYFLFFVPPNLFTKIAFSKFLHINQSMQNSHEGKTN